MAKNTIKSNPKETPSEALESILIEGINITRTIGLVTDCMKLSDVRKRYYLWVYRIKEFCEKNKVDTKLKSFFYEEDDVFSTIGRGCGVDLQSNFSQKLVKDISSETKKKMEYLRKIELEKKQESTKKNNNQFPHKLPAGTKWENFIIQFLDEENISVKVGKFKVSVNYKDMKFVGKGNNQPPSEAWNFLKVLAKLNGELNVQDSEAKDKYKKQKEFLTKGLQNYFSIDYDPFYPYHGSLEKRETSYKIKATLLPPPEKDEIKQKSSTDPLGIKEYISEQAPLKIEDD